MARTREPVTGRRPPRVPPAGLRGDPPGPTQRPVPQPVQVQQAPGNGPVVVLTYHFSGWRRLQGVLEQVPELACTAGTGVLGMCDTAARAWANVDQNGGGHMSSLAAKSIRAMVTTMMTIMVTRSSGARRWCEIATAEPAAAEAFLRVVPGTQFLCLHRSCPDVVRAVLASSPWGIIGGQFTPYLQAHPGNATAAIAACWADSAGQLLDFEARHPGSALRVRYEDLAGDPAATTRAISDFTGVTPASPVPWLADDEPPGGGTSAGDPAGPDAVFPAAALPPHLVQRINHLHEQLNYPHVPEPAGPAGTGRPGGGANGDGRPWPPRAE